MLHNKSRKSVFILVFWQKRRSNNELLTPIPIAQMRDDTQFRCTVSDANSMTGYSATQLYWLTDYRKNNLILSKLQDSTTTTTTTTTSTG